MATRRIVAIVMSVILVVVIALAMIPATRNAIGGWFTSIFSSEEKPDEGSTTPTEGNNTTTPGDETTNPTEGTTDSTTPTEGEENDEVLIDDMSQEERVALVFEKLDEIAAREDGDNEYTLEEAFMMTMHIVVTEDGKVIESGHNMPAPGVETYSMDTFPGGWTWAEATEEMHTLVFISGHKLSVVQSQVTANTEYVPGDEEPTQIAFCKHGNAILSGFFVRSRGDLTIVTFDATSFEALKSIFRWWYEIDENGQQIIKIGFNYCNDAPEGTEGVIPVIVPSLRKGK